MSDLLVLNNISCSYQQGDVVKNLSLSIPKGMLACLLGSSGCGKTTVLRAIAGFEPVTSGTIFLRGKEVSSSGFRVAPEKRKVGVVFQEYALFPHLDIFKNIAFGLGNQDADHKTQRVQDLLQLVGLEGYGKRYPHELSGGQQQRIALARALAPAPDIVLLDEPFSNLDVDLRERLSLEVREILKSQDITSIMVTHDQHEAFAMADKIAVMHEGRILQWDTAYNLYHQPQARFVADFIGQGAFLKGTVLSEQSIETEAGILTGPVSHAFPTGTVVDILLRPDDIQPDTNGAIIGKVIQKSFKGAEILYRLQLPSGGNVLSLFPSHHNHELGDSVPIRLDTEHLVVFAVNL